MSVYPDKSNTYFFGDGDLAISGYWPFHPFCSSLHVYSSFTRKRRVQQYVPQVLG